MRRDAHYIVLGAAPKADKGALAYFDEKAGMFAVKILQLDETKEKDDGKDGFSIEDVDGEYTTIYFAHQRGRDSLRMLIEVLTDLQTMMDRKYGIPP